MVDVLPKLFGSSARVKLLRLFLLNPDFTFTIAEAGSRSRVPEKYARKEILLFTRLGLITRTGKNPHYGLTPDFPNLAELQNLLLSTSLSTEDIVKRLKGTGNIKFALVAGMFIGEWDGRVDLFVVGDQMREDVLSRQIKILESELGREIRYAVLSTQEFFYRLSMNDHLVRDVLDFPHVVVTDRLGIETE
ncbi:MAG TPA: hypothetical protein VD928_01915 [Candidatus Paceibacterota bacterium]|nr:hypothetical protein [Candidatus Paceibacterota bacterium]